MMYQYRIYLQDIVDELNERVRKKKMPYEKYSRLTKTAQRWLDTARERGVA